MTPVPVHAPHDAADIATFERCFAANYSDIARYCARRLSVADDAQDAATETFAVAWRRRADRPPPPEDRLWLFGIARRVLANQHRADGRRRRLADRLRDSAAEPASQFVLGEGADAVRVREALDALSPGHRELLLLAGWEGLTVAEMSDVLGVPGPVISRRLHRARARFAKLLDFDGPAGDPDASGHVRVNPASE